MGRTGEFSQGSGLLVRGSSVLLGKLCRASGVSVRARAWLKVMACIIHIYIYIYIYIYILFFLIFFRFSFSFFLSFLFFWGGRRHGGAAAQNPMQNPSSEATAQTLQAFGLNVKDLAVTWVEGLGFRVFFFFKVQWPLSRVWGLGFGVWGTWCSGTDAKPLKPPPGSGRNPEKPQVTQALG